MPLTAGELAEARADMSQESMPDICTVTHVTTVQNDSGTWSETIISADAIACRLGPLSGRERVLGGRIVEESDAVLTMPYDADVRGSDRITHDGTTYEVVDIVERSEALVLRVAVKGSA
ncbi:MAG: phage head closure protein [Chloroflexota bacterium]|nr:phage head closure protein [Chloroflexota bacterium]